MALFAIVTENSRIVQEFINKSRDKLKGTNIVYNPFVGDIQPFIYSENKDEINKSLYIVSMRPVYFNYSMFGWIILAAMIAMFRSWNIWLLLPIGLCSLGIFWTKYFYYIILKLGLKKAGYTGYIRLVSLNEAIENMYFKEV